MGAPANERLAARGRGFPGRRSRAEAYEAVDRVETHHLAGGSSGGRTRDRATLSLGPSRVSIFPGIAARRPAAAA
jgi:hypothetical protein